MIIIDKNIDINIYIEQSCYEHTCDTSIRLDGNKHSSGISWFFPLVILVLPLDFHNCGFLVSVAKNDWIVDLKFGLTFQVNCHFSNWSLAKEFDLFKEKQLSYCKSNPIMSKAVGAPPSWFGKKKWFWFEWRYSF